MDIPPISEWTVGLWFGFLYVGVLTPVLFFWLIIKPHIRRKPDGYVGRFRHPNGQVVHVARVNGELMVISDENPGIQPRDLGNVTGRDLAQWLKLATTPDGNDRIPRPD